MKLFEVAEHLNCKLEGDGEIEIIGVAGIDEAQPGHLTFVSNPRYGAALKTTRASAVLVSAGVDTGAAVALRSADPYLDFSRAIDLFHQTPRYEPEVHPTAVISTSAQIGVGAHIGPYCFIDEDVVIGANAVLHSFVTIYRAARIGQRFFAHSHSCVRENCQLGDRVILQNGVVIGGDGFGYAREADGGWRKTQQAGITVLEDDVEVQANSAVDRATIGETRIGRGTKIDDLVVVGHASKVGEDTLLCGQVGLAGSTRVGNRCILAGQSGAGGHLTIGDGAVFAAQSGIHNDMPGNTVYSGTPALEMNKWLKVITVFTHLADVNKNVRELQAQVARLQKSAPK
jgi:UDP-3-O-[3-hydroxymyristoyl] glucosamine N-acyltransferase